MDDIIALSKAGREAEKRILRQHRLPVFDYSPSQPKGSAALAAPGTVTLYLARRGSRILRELANAIVHRSSRDVELARRIRAILERRPHRLPADEAVNMLIEQPVFADLHYGGKTLVSSLFVPEDMEVVSVVFPYNGGRLARGGFTLVEYVRDLGKVGLAGLVVRSSPPLTRTETLALQLLPSNQLEANVGSGVVGVEDDNLAVTLVTLAALGAGVALAAAVEAAVPAAVVAEAAGVDVAALVGEAGIGAAVNAAIDAAVAWATANADVTVIQQQQQPTQLTIFLPVKTRPSQMLHSSEMLLSRRGLVLAMRGLVLARVVASTSLVN